MKSRAGTRRNRSSKEMYPIVEAYMLGSLSRSSFCSQHNLSISALNYWQTKYRKSQEVSKTKDRSNFIAVEVSPASERTPVMELELGEKGRLKFFSYPDPAYLKSVLILDLC